MDGQDTGGMRTRSGGQVLMDQLLIHGADRAFCVPGESYLELLDAIHDHKDRFTLVNARHEAGAANMAEAHGKLTGRPGICMVTRGPGACHAAIGVHIAAQDSTPMILLIGQVGRGMMDREAFQEIDYRRMFGSVAKWVAQIDRAERVPEYLSRAFRTATSGRPGPVVLALPEDMLTDSVTVADAPPYTATLPQPAPEAIDRLCALLAEASKPLVLLGGPGWDDESSAAIARFAEANALPCAVSFRRQDSIDNRSPAYVGEFGTGVPPYLVEAIAEADTLLVIGARLGEITTKGYETLDPQRPGPRLIHVHADPDEIGRVHAPLLGIAADSRSVARALDGRELGRRQDWRSRAEALRAAWRDDTAPPGDGGFALNMGQVFAELRDALPCDMIVTLDAGNHTGWAQRYLHFGRPGREIGSTCGAMGYAVPAAVSAALCHPDRLVLAMVGDGGFMMTGLELATAVQHGARPIVLVFNNGIYGTIRMHQERAHPGRVSGTTLGGTDITALAQALGAHAERVQRTEEFAPALARAREAGRAAVIELITDPEQISTRTTLERMRAAAATPAHPD